MCSFSEFVRSQQYVSVENRWGSAFLASIISGFFVSCAMAPFDLLSTRFYNQGIDENGKGYCNIQWTVDTALQMIFTRCSFHFSRSNVSLSVGLCQ